MGEGVHQVIEVGGAGTLARSLEAVKPGGIVSLIGILTGTAGEINPLPILLKAVRLEGVLVGSVQMLDEMNRAFERLAPRPIIDEVFPLRRASDALARMAAAAHVGKIVVQLD